MHLSRHSAGAKCGSGSAWGATCAYGGTPPLFDAAQCVSEPARDSRRDSLTRERVQLGTPQGPGAGLGARARGKGGRGAGGQGRGSARDGHLWGSFQAAAGSRKCKLPLQGPPRIDHSVNGAGREARGSAARRARGGRTRVTADS